MVLDRFSLRRNRVSLPKNATFRITQEGTEKISDGTMTPQMRVLVALQTTGSSADVDELAGASGLSRGRVEKIMIALLQKGYVQRVGGARTSSEDE